MAGRSFWRRQERTRPLVDERGVRSRRSMDDDVVVDRNYVDRSEYVDEPAEDRVVERRRTAIQSMSLRQMIDGLVWVGILALEALLAIRFALLAFDARQSGFVKFIMDISAPIVRPFRDTFTLRTWDQGVLDYNILLAMGVWFLAGLLLLLVLNMIIPDTRDDYSRVDHRRRITHS